MNKRIKEIRQSENMSLVKFASKIGISDSAVKKLETGENNPSEQTIRAICSEFGINRLWLETGEGEMRKPVTREEELAELFADLLKDQPDFRHRLLTVLLRSTPEEWEIIERKARELVEEMQKTGPQ